MRCWTVVVLLVASFFQVAPVAAQPVDEPDPLFRSDEILQARLTGPLFTLIDKKSKEDYLQGQLSIVDDDGETLQFDLRFRARGNFRHENCDYPPVRLNFKKSQTKDTLFDKQDKLKLVVHCNKRAEYQQIVLEEYVAYRILNLLTDLSLRVRLLQIIYADPEEEFESPKRYAFLIEHKKRAAKRFGLKEFKTPGTKVGELDPAQLNLTSVFQYFIGNTDFSPVAAARGDDCCHNYLLFKNPDTKIFPVPYDFDQSGLVDAPYAVVNPHFKLRSVKQRRYRGRCVNNTYLEQSIQKFLDNRDEIYALINEQTGFSEGTREGLVRYVDAFYETVAEPKRVESQIRKRCI